MYVVTSPGEAAATIDHNESPISSWCSHPEDGHGDQPQHVGKHQLLVDGEVEPGVLGQQRRGGRVALRGQEQREDADHRRHARDVVRGLPRSLC